MTLKEFCDTNWKRGNEVLLKNGKEYLVKGVKGHGRYILLYSAEYDSCFVADYRIVDRRTSDYEEPEEVYLELKRQKQAEAEAKREAERQAYLKEKEERKQRNLKEQERIHLEALARKAAKRNNQQVQKTVEAQKPAPKPAAKSEPVAQSKPAVKAEPVAQPKPVAKAEPVVQSKPAVKAEPIATAAPAAEQPKKKRKRIMISKVEKVQLK